MENHSKISIDFLHTQIGTTVQKLTALAFGRKQCVDKDGTPLNKKIPVKCSHLTVHYVKKHSGGFRQIVAYDKQMSYILDKLYLVLQQVLLPRIHPAVIGGTPGSSIKNIVSTLSKHMPVHRGMLGHLDIKNWYPSIMVPDIVKSLQPYFTENCANLIAELTSFRGKLTQGSPCSTLIANHVASTTWAPVVEKYCEEHNIKLQIYIDNLCMVAGGDLQNFSGQLEDIRRIIKSFGFQTHKKSIHGTGHRQSILGTILNGPYEPRVNKSLLKQLCTIAYKIQKDTLTNVTIDWAIRNGIKPGTTEAELYGLKMSFFGWIMGQIGWITSIKDAPKAQELKKEFIKLFA